MPRYTAKLSSGDGSIIYKQLHAHTAKDVFVYFREEGYFVFSVKRNFKWEKKISLKDFLLFNRELIGLLQAGLPIVDGLAILLKKMPSSAMKSMLTQVQSKLVKGASLSESFRAFTHLIPSYYPTLVYSGEQSGQLVSVLQKFIIQEDRKRQAIKRFKQALTYPAILMAVAAVALYVILGRAMPEFTALYADSGKELPVVTQAVIVLSNYVTAYSPYLLLAIVALLFLRPLMRHGGILNASAEKLIMWLPVLGSVWRLHNQNSFISTLKLLLQGGIPMAKALKTIRTAIPSNLLSDELEKVWNDVLCGQELSAALEKHTFFESRVIEMVRIGETSGTLEDMLEHLMVYGEEKLDDHLGWVSGIIAPVILLVVGAFIALLILAMYLPMFQAADLISQ
ncbi:MAG: hypothetical protein CR997_10215 [Acidobacteria bacterium]|nr:MAG: hypothetical protein CR997_10215 [Acidobacteriota bacterium]